MSFYEPTRSNSRSDGDGLPHSVRIEYRNQTDDPKVVVVVASRNVSEQDADRKDHLVAWKLLATQTRIFFRYPKLTSVGAFFNYDHEIVMSGPFPADPGCYWRISQDTHRSAPVLLEGRYFFLAPRS